MQTAREIEKEYTLRIAQALKYYQISYNEMTTTNKELITNHINALNCLRVLWEGIRDRRVQSYPDRGLKGYVPKYPTTKDGEEYNKNFSC